MNELSRIKDPIQTELNEFERYFRKSLKSSVPLLDIITNYVLRKKGKQVRPTFVLLSARMFGEIGDPSYTAASLIELLHTASIIHDDVVDESFERRGFFSINALWKSKVAVLVGDYLLAKGLLLSVEHKQYDLLEIVSIAVKEMSEGELLQIQKSRKLNINQEDYFEIIRKKTAALIAACTACGARSAGANEDQIKLMKEFGENAGIAFQIKDDLFDYERNGRIGKPTANDIKEKKMTLPLIHALEVCPSADRKRILSIIRHHNRNADKVDEVIEFVRNFGGLSYAQMKMEEYKNIAFEKLNHFKDSESKRSLESLLEFIIKRNE